MVRMTYPGLGTREAAVTEFDAFKPYVTALRAMQFDCPPDSPECLTLDIPILGLETTAFHFTRRPHYYDQLRVLRDRWRTDYPGLGENAAVAAFADLAPYVRRLGALKFKCRPFGRDYQALCIATTALNTAVYHFTKEAAFYGLKGDSAGRFGPPQ
jgi:hypothetical protein